MNRLSRAPDADPLYARPAAERPSYATGMLLDAQDFTAPPVATVHLPVRVPFGFHGNWVPS